MRSVLTAIFLSLALFGPSHAYDQRDLATCMSLEPPEPAIAACTRMIADRNLNAPTRSNMFSNRGWSYHLSGDDARSLADLNEALRLNPKNVAALSNRGGLYIEEGSSKWDAALVDLNKALELDPKFLLALNNRGDLNRRKREYRAALRDFDRAVEIDPRVWNPHYGRGLVHRNLFDYEKSAGELELVRKLRPQMSYAAHVLGVDRWMLGDLSGAYDALAAAVEASPKNPYTFLLFDIVGQRLGKASQPDKASALDKGKWPAPAVRLLLGQTNPDAVLAAAKDPDPSTEKNQLCEANFYVGEWALRTGAKDDATARFKAAAKSCPDDYDELIGAQKELKDLGAPL